MGIESALKVTLLALKNPRKRNLRKRNLRNRVQPNWVLAALPLAFGFPAQRAAAQSQTPSLAPAAEDARPELPPKVLQNRYFLKAMRPEISFFGGSVLNESYSNTWSYGARAGMFFTEAFGVEGTFAKFVATDTEDLKALSRISYREGSEIKTVRPSYVRLEQALGLTASFVPIYGKINFLDWQILYSDLYVGGGFASIATLRQPDNAKKDVGALVLNIGQRFYFAKNFNVRIDATDHIFEEERENLGQTKKSTRHAWVVSLGLSAFLYNPN